MSRFLPLPLLFVLFMVTACSYSSVGHLQRQPWVLNVEQQLPMRFWNFSFIAESAHGQYRLMGRAKPKLESLPPNLHWIEDLWLAVYLSDDQGRVLAQDLRVFSSLALDPDQGVPFTFVLRPDRLNRSSVLQVTFGYNMTLTPHESYMTEEAPKKQQSGERTSVFFAHEGALTRI